MLNNNIFTYATIMCLQKYLTAMSSKNTMTTWLSSLMVAKGRY